MNHLVKQKLLYELELLGRFIQHLQQQRLRRTSAEKPKSDDYGILCNLNATRGQKSHQNLDNLSQRYSIIKELTMYRVPGWISSSQTEKLYYQGSWVAVKKRILSFHAGDSSMLHNKSLQPVYDDPSHLHLLELGSLEGSSYVRKSIEHLP